METAADRCSEDIADRGPGRPSFSLRPHCGGKAVDLRSTLRVPASQKADGDPELCLDGAVVSCTACVGDVVPPVSDIARVIEKLLL